MHFNFINIQAYEIKLTRKFKYTENLAGAHVMQVDVMNCDLQNYKLYSWLPSLSKYGCQDLFVYEGNQLILVCEGNQLILMIDTLFLL